MTVTIGTWDITVVLALVTAILNAAINDRQE